MTAKRFRTLESVVRDSTYLLNYSVLILSALGGLALLLAAIGIYGTLSCSVRERTREIGLRMALGASRGSVTGLALRQGLVGVCVGIVIGLARASLLMHYHSSLLYGVARFDAVTFAIVGVVMLATACVASYLPARWAARVDPMAALRQVGVFCPPLPRCSE